MTQLDEMMAQIPQAVVGLCRELRRAGHEAWLVGGAIRDLSLGRAAADFDIATSARPDEMRRVFARRRLVPTGEKHGTMTVLLPGVAGLERGVEVTTFRGEGAYSDGRRPDRVEFVSSLEQDLERRDFTVNALAFDPLDGRLLDPFAGRRDLDERCLRAVGDPLARFREDGLRVMRAVRLAAQLAFTLDPLTREAIPGALDVLARVSQERVRDELLKLLAAPRPSLGLHLMQETGILAQVLPEAARLVGLAQNRFHAHDVWEHTVVTVDEMVGGSLARLAALLHDLGKPATAAAKDDQSDDLSFYQHETVGAELADAVCRRFKLSNYDREWVVALVRHHMFWYAPAWTDATVRRFIARVGVDLLPGLYALRAADVRARGRGEDPGRELDELMSRVAREIEAQRALKVSDLAVGGQDVMAALACSPGPLVGEVLRRLLERVVDDPELNHRETLLSLIPEVARTIVA